MSRATATLFVLLLLVGIAACRREHPGPPRTATAAAAARAAAVAMPTATSAPTAVAGLPGASAAASGGRRGKISGGNLGVAATGIAAGIQLWSKAGGILAGGATMTGTVPDGTVVEVLKEEDFLGQKYFQIKGGDREGWIDGRFVEVQSD